ncbi:MAG: c-type cytochrome [Acidobacteria bacterium]|nr:c-type cytochrome [Acidobacteriota bacterium]
MRRSLILASGALLWAQAPTVKLEDPAVISKGSNIFGARCGIGYCHGKEGRAGRGPRLAGRKLDKTYLFTTISNGTGNSAMPAFKAQLSTDEIWSVVAYILSLSGEGAGPAASPASPPAPAAPAKPADPNSGDPEAGRALFFDASNPKNCAACHRFQGRGADVGPDLTAAFSRPPREILRDIIEPGSRLAVESITVVTKSGERITGLEKQETPEFLRLYDTSALPPVLRTIYKDQIEKVTPERHSPMPSDYGRVFTRKQLLDLVSFLKSISLAPGELE